MKGRGKKRIGRRGKDRRNHSKDREKRRKGRRKGFKKRRREGKEEERLQKEFGVWSFCLLERLATEDPQHSRANSSARLGLTVGATRPSGPLSLVKFRIFKV